MIALPFVLAAALGASAATDKSIPLSNLVPPWEKLGTPRQLPIRVAAFTEHVGAIEESAPVTEAARAWGLGFGPDGRLRLVPTPEVRRALGGLAPPLLQALTEVADPDLALTTFERFIAGVAARIQGR